MDDNERQVIDELFEKIRAVEERSGGRDDEAERRICDHLGRQPAAPYYMAQTILVQQQALAAAEARIDELERQASERASNSFLTGLFGGSPPTGVRRQTPSPSTSGWDARVSAYADPRHRQGGGFLAGAAQTAVGVAGGVLLGSALAELFAADAAASEIGDDERLFEDTHYEEESDTGFDTDDSF
ncbi:MAG: DUF2076 domain-containing protein [Rhodospirillales bacterium]